MPRISPLMFLLLPAALCAAGEPEVDFAHDIRPILSDHCFACHGPDQEERQGGLRLDQAEGALAATDSGEPAIVPGDVEGSVLVERIRSTDPYEVMPPPEAHKPLSEQQKVLIERWIAAGAPFVEHWSFVPPKRHTPPQRIEAEHAAASSDPIDRFVLARLERAGLAPNGPADRAALLRRVTLDLTGLPPTPAELDAFLADDSPEAYERVVDRLLQSPRYGEHLARYWLDLVRFGDTHGLHLDNYREMWPYRDWVIRALNENKPFDDFLTEQLAGDLLPDATLEDQIASGFNRLNVTTNEGGSIYEEVFARNVTDRTESFGTIFLGLTTGCAACHDHKFDPISQREFYSLSAFFNSLDGQAMDGNVEDHPPVVRVPTAEHLRQLAEVDAMADQLAAEMDGPLPGVDQAERQWARAIARADAAAEPPAPEWIPLRPDVTSSSSGTTLETDDDGSVRASGSLPEKETVTIEAPLPAGGPFQLIRLEALTDTADEPAGRSPNGNAVLSEIEVAFRSPETDGEYLPVNIVYGEADYTQSDSDRFSLSYAFDGETSADAGWAIGGHQRPGPRTAWFVAGHLLGQTDGSAHLRVTLKYQSQFAGHQFKRVRLSVSDQLPVASPERQLQFGEWHSVGPFEVENTAAGYRESFASQNREFKADETFTYRDQTYRWQSRGDFRAATANPLPVIDDRSSVTLLHRRITAPVAQKLTLLLGTEDGYQVWIGGQKVAEVTEDRSLVPLSDEITVDLQAGVNDLYIKTVRHQGPAAFAAAFRSPAAPVPPAIREIAAKPDDDRSASEAAALRSYYRRVASIHPDWLVLRDMAEGLRKRREEIRQAMPTTLVWRELETPRPAFVLKRGEYNQPGEEVTRGVPAALPPFPSDAPRNRLGLARWLTSPDHPLTARVAVNRYWQQLFGTGLVKTSEDFGAQGETPSHPQLLDTLAVDFIEDGWNVKRLIKRMVMSSTYRRSAAATPEMLALDPENRLLARGPRFRLDAEMLRDQALAVSGLLVEKLGGPSVKPPQPKGLWFAVAYTSSNTANFVPDTGADVYRRSVYTFWKRTSPPPQMTAFDAPSRESCTARRARTNTPLQALLLMNEPQYIEAAKALAARSSEMAGDDDAERIRWMFKAVVSRSPSDAEITELTHLLRDAVELYAGAPETLQAFGAASPTAAAHAVVASTILNLDEALNK